MQYCVLKGYLRRVREYRISLDDPTHVNPIKTATNGLPNGTSAENGKNKSKKPLRDLCDGTNDSDSLACHGYSMYSRTRRRNDLLFSFRRSIQCTFNPSWTKSFTTINSTHGLLFNTLEMRFLCS